MYEENNEVIEEQNNKNKGFIKGALVGALSALIIVGVGIFLFMTFVFDGQIIYETSAISVETIEKLDMIQEYIEEEYLYEVDVDALQDGIIAGYMEALDDPYTAYLDEEETTDILESTSGEYSGIGAVMSQDLETYVITIVSVFEGSPAEEAGMQAGDILVTVDGEDISNLDVSSVVMNVKGEEGTTVEIGVLRGSNYESLSFTVTRAVVEYQTVSYEMLEGQIGYIYVSEFDTVTTDQFATALNDLEEQGMESLIIDLRNNTGGNLSTVCEMSELLLPEGLIVYTEDKNGEGAEYYSTGENEFTKPLVVLVNGYTASASEILTAAIQDYGIGVIVGTTTYGKGVVQTLIYLPDSTMIKYTSSEYFTPLGNNIHGTGITPDVEIEYDYEDWETDEQLEKAIEVINEY